jgi:archaellum component FlaC
MRQYLHYVLILPLLLLVACGDRTDTDYTTDTTTHEQDDRHMRAELQSWLDDIDRNFEQLQARSQQTGEDWSSDINDLRERRDEIRADLQRMGGTTAGTMGQTGTDRTMGDDQYADSRADGVATGTTGETQDGTTRQGTAPGTTTPGTTTPGTGYGTTGYASGSGDYDRLRERMKDLDSDIEELRLRTITSRDEFIAEVDTRLNEIDRELDALTRRDGMATGQGTTTQPGTQDRAMTDDRTMADDRTATGTTGAGTTTRGAYADRGDVDVEGLREDRDDVREMLADLRAGEREFESDHESMAEQVADLRARVKSATVQTGSSTSMTGTHQQSATVNQDVDV